jgi:hypothetical protein
MSMEVLMPRAQPILRCPLSNRESRVGMGGHMRSWLRDLKILPNNGRTYSGNTIRLKKLFTCSYGRKKKRR